MSGMRPQLRLAAVGLNSPPAAALSCRMQGATMYGSPLGSLSSQKLDCEWWPALVLTAAVPTAAGPSSAGRRHGQTATGDSERPKGASVDPLQYASAADDYA